MDEREKPATAQEDLESGKDMVNLRWLKQVCGKWPGDESIEELLAALVSELRTLTGKVNL
jgi:hypothetical protein